MRSGMGKEQHTLKKVKLRIKNSCRTMRPTKLQLIIATKPGLAVADPTTQNPIISNLPNFVCSVENESIDFE